MEISNRQENAMLDFAKARINMLESQIRTNGVIDPAVLQAFEAVPKEAYMPASLRNVAYLDENIVLPGGRIVLEPQTHARMVQVARPQADDVALVVGDSCGYAAAILAQIVTTVLSVMDHAADIEQVTKAMTEQGICNIVPFESSAMDGLPQHAPYSLIFINGAVTEIPEIYKSQLAVGGRLVCVVKQDDNAMGRIVVLENLGNDVFSSYTHYDAGVPFLPEFRPRAVFDF